MSNDTEFVTLSIDDVLSGTGLGFLVVDESKTENDKKDTKEQEKDKKDIR